MRILVDGDASGRREHLIAAALEFDIELVWVVNYSQEPPEAREGLRLTVKQVDVESQAVDMVLMNDAGPGDLLVTGDLGLASVCVAKGCAVLSPKGHWFKREDMLQRLEWRALSARLRRGGVQLDKPPAQRRLDDWRFEQELRTALEAAIEEG